MRENLRYQRRGCTHPPRPVSHSALSPVVSIIIIQNQTMLTLNILISRMHPSLSLLSTPFLAKPRDVVTTCLVHGPGNLSTLSGPLGSASYEGVQTALLPLGYRKINYKSDSGGGGHVSYLNRPLSPAR